MTFRGWPKWRVRREDELDEEIESHLRMAAEERAENGDSAEQAHAAAAREFGNVALVKETTREMWGYRRLETLLQDVRYGLRQLRRNPGFALTVIVTLALSIGANTAIFSIANALLLKKLPYAHPEQLGTIYTRITGLHSSDERHGLDGEQWELLRDNVRALISAVFSRGTSGVNFRAGSQAQYLHAGRISEHYLDVLAIQPILGRTFSADEDRPHGPKAVILSYSLWRNTFSSNPEILGRAILLKGEPYTVIGVLPEGATTPLNADLYTALQPSREGEGGGTNFGAITRLRDGATWQEADAEINRTWLHRSGRYELKDNPGAQVTYYSVPLQKGETDNLRPEVLALLLAAGFILLIACSNLAGLTLVRMIRRNPEIATRLALGASRWQIQRQLWIENLQLALIGGATAVLVGYLSLRAILLLLPEHFLPVESVPLDGQVLGFTLFLALLTSLLFGMLPAITTKKVDLRSAMASRSVAGVGSQRLREVLISAEVALTVVLLSASGLLIRTLIHLEKLPQGFNPNGVMVAKASLDDARFHDPAAFRKLLDEGTAAMRQIPGVQNAAVGLSLPYERTLNNWITLSDGKEAGQGGGSDVVYVTPGFFDTLQMAFVAGRVFTDADGPDAQRVAVVNQSFAHKFYGGANPVGRYINKNTLIVGEVSDVPISSGLDRVAPLQTEQTMYIPAAQVDAQALPMLHVWFQPDWIVRTAGPVEGLTAQMQRALESADPNLPFSGFYSMRDLMAMTLATQRVEVALLSAMAMLALLMSAVGIFALVANLVAQRTREIGIRIALGSTIQSAMIQIGKSGVGASALGLVLGLLLCAVALPAMRSALYGVGVYDVPTIVLVVVTLLAVSLLAVTLPALRVARIDPAVTLRDQ